MSFLPSRDKLHDSTEVKIGRCLVGLSFELYIGLKYIKTIFWTFSASLNLDSSVSNILWLRLGLNHENSITSMDRLLSLYH